MMNDTQARPHECPLCTCTRELCSHCEDHFTDARFAGNGYLCRPCEATGRLDLEHHTERDFDGTWFCPSCPATWRDA